MNTDMLKSFFLFAKHRHLLVRVIVLIFLIGSSANGAENIAPVASTSPTAIPDRQGDVVQPTASVVPGLTRVPDQSYQYQLTGRADPFKPFIAPKTVNPNDLVDDNKELTGMQLFEPGQLSLVAIMDTPSGRIAMVEDVTKKGYMLRKGILIGRNGEVTEIMKDQVVVTETAHTRGGDEIKTVVSMKLKRDGESQ